MNVMALLGILAIFYAAAVAWIALKKPEKIWKMAKIQMFVKLMGEKGTVIFFYVWAVLFTVLGIWLLLK